MEIIPIIDCRNIITLEEDKSVDVYIVDLLEQKKELYLDFQIKAPFTLICDQSSNTKNRMDNITRDEDILITAPPNQLMYEVFLKEISIFPKSNNETRVIGTSLRYPSLKKNEIEDTLRHYPDSYDFLVSINSPEIPIGRYWKKKDKEKIEPFISAISPFERRQDQPKTVIITNALFIARQWGEVNSTDETKIRPISLSEESNTCQRPEELSHAELILNSDFVGEH